MHKNKLFSFIVCLFFLGILSVSAKTEGVIEGNRFIESDEQTNYVKMELFDDEVLLFRLDSSHSDLGSEFTEYVMGNYYDGAEVSVEPLIYHVNESQFDPLVCSSKKFKSPKYGDLMALYDEEDCSVSGFDIYLGENGTEKMPIIAHLVAGEKTLNRSFSAIKSIRFVDVKKESTTTKDDVSDDQTSNDTSSKKEENNSRQAVTSYCSDDLELLKTFKFIGKILSIVKILIPLVIIILGAIDFFKAIIASKDDEIKKSMRSLMFRVLAGVIIFFIPTIVNLIFMLIDDWGNYRTDYSVCSTCVTNPSKCKV
jgi:hypothetical protein